MLWNVFYHLYLLHIAEAERSAQGSISRLKNNVSLHDSILFGVQNLQFLGRY